MRLPPTRGTFGCRYTHAVFAKTLLMLAVLATLPQPAAAPPTTDIYELALTGTIDTIATAPPRPVSTEPGYDNQPAYTPDGASLLFTANRDGKQTDIYEFDRKTRRVKRLTDTAEAEYSPTVTPDGQGISVIRVEADSTQRLWRFERSGSNPRLVLADIKPVGYHAWIDADQLALFVLGKPSTLQHARVSTGKAVIVADNIGRSLHLVPKSSLVSFIHRESPDSIWVKHFDAATGVVTPLVRVVGGNDEGDVAWTPDGTLLMSSGRRILAWRRGDKDWRTLVDLSAHTLGAVTRMAVAPGGDAVAIVVNESRP